MFDKLDLLHMARGLAAHSADRQAVLARNVSNADTPGFRAQDIGSFAEAYRLDDGTALRRTRSGHLGGLSEGQSRSRPVDVGGEASPNGNTVSLETEMVRAVEVKRGHDVALAVYRTSLDILRSSIGRGR